MLAPPPHTRLRSIQPVLDRAGRPLRDLRVSVTDRCNFRCIYCMPESAYPKESRYLPSQRLLSFDEIERLVRLFVNELGVRKVRISGGEPLLRPGLPDLVARLAAIPGLSDLALTTNGYLLSDLAPALARAGLSRLTVSLDSLDPQEFAALSGGQAALEQVLDGIDAAITAGLAPLKINCVVMRGRNQGAILSLARRFRGTAHVVRFIEYMDVGTINGWQRSDVVPANEILESLAAAGPLVALAPNYPGEVARRYGWRDTAGEVGIIASVTQPFCGACHRARLSADGRLLTCLFAASGVDILGMLRSGESDSALLARIGYTWRERNDRYSEDRHARSQSSAHKRLEMYQIGG